MALKSFNDGSSDEARQFLLDRRDERNHPKRHRTQKRSKVISAKKRAKAKARAARNLAAYRDYVAKVRAYWAGLGDHPT